MTNKTIEDVEHLNQLNKKVSEMVSRWVNEAKEEGIKIGLGADKAELIEKLLQENKALREQAAQTMPSENQFMKWLATNKTPPSYQSVYDWLKAKTKPKERHEVSECTHKICPDCVAKMSAALERK